MDIVKKIRLCPLPERQALEEVDVPRDICSLAWLRRNKGGPRSLYCRRHLFGHHGAHRSSLGLNRKWEKSSERFTSPTKWVDDYKGMPSHSDDQIFYVLTTFST
jgi:hypothetical protein